MGSKTGKTIAVIAAIMMFSGRFLFAQNIQDDEIAGVMAGLFYAFERAEDSDEDGKNVGASVTWETRHGQKDLLRLSFDNFRFYVAEETPGSGSAPNKRILTLNGNLGLDDYLDGRISVGGGMAVSSIFFRNYDPYQGENGGEVTVNNRPYGNEDFKKIVEQAENHVSEDRIIDAEREIVMLFVSVLMAVEESDLDEQMGSPGSPPAIPPGLRASNSEGTFSAVTRDGSIDLGYRGYTPQMFSDYFMSPVLDGEIAMKYEIRGTSMDAVIFDGGVRVRGMTFVSSLRFDSCRMDEENESASGSITVDGKSSSFRDLLAAGRVLF
ncbi:MAG: hypothetical protein LBK08_02455 [Treponema sp.]|jgi:hypothetical protein|nr:hypothetical protein [Treponema sp.]